MTGAALLNVLLLALVALACVWLVTEPLRAALARRVDPRGPDARGVDHIVPRGRRV